VRLGPNGQFVNSGSGDNTIKLWRRDRYCLTTDAQDHTNEVWGVVSNLTGEPRQLLTCFPQTLERMVPCLCLNIAVKLTGCSPDGQMIVSISDVNSQTLAAGWNYLRRTLYGHSVNVSGVAFKLLVR